MKTKHSICFRSAFTFLVLFLVLTTVIMAQLPPYYNFNTTVGSNSFPFNTSVAAGKNVQWLVGPGEFNQPTPAPSGNITSIWFRTSTAGAGTYTNLTIKMGQTAITTMPTGAYYTGTMTTVYFRASVTLTATANTFLEIVLDTPFPYNPAQSLVIDVQQCGITSGGFSVNQTTMTGFLRRNYSVTGGCPQAYSGQDATLVNSGVTVAPAGQNYAMKLPTPGVNTNYVAIPHQAGMIGFPNMTIEAWVKTGGSTTANTVLNKGGVSFDYQLGINATTNNPFFRAQGVITAATTMTITPNVWTHLAVTYDGTTVRFYKDGVMGFSMAAVSPPGVSTNEMRIGRGNADAGSGNIEELRLWTVARTQGALDSNKCRKYPSSFSSSTGLRALWHLDSNFVDSVSSFNGSPLGTVTFDTVSFPIPGVNCDLVGIEHEGNIIPNTFSLEQNYPNPFNPVTNIKFSIPKDGFVEIKIYDILGKEVSTLIEDPFEAGTYTVTFDASKLSSGVYFYKLVSGDFSQTKKMLLIK